MKPDRVEDLCIIAILVALVLLFFVGLDVARADSLDELLEGGGAGWTAGLAVQAHLLWALLDLVVAATVFAVLTKIPFFSNLFFEYDDEIDIAAAELKDEGVPDAAKAAIVHGLCRVKAARMLGFAIILAAALIE